MIKRDYSIKLTLAVYKVAGLLPDNEPLKYKIKDKAGDILAKLILANPNEKHLDREGLLEDIKIINGFFDIAREQEWIDSLNFQILEQEYNRIIDNIKSHRSEHEENKKSEDDKSRIYTNRDSRTKTNFLKNNLSSRQKRIIEILKGKGSMRLAELHIFFPQVNERTLRRDFQILISQNIAKRFGQGKQMFYRLVS